MPKESRKLHTLDAFRGIAALIVVVYHGEPFFPHPHHGYLAVDLFFGLSGFVLSLAYQERLDQGLTLAEFMRIRFVRLAPLYYLALALGLVTALVLHSYDWRTCLEYLALALFLIPARASTTMFPLDGPFWSLLIEVLVNIAHGLFWRRLSTRTLCWMVAGSACLLSWSVLFYRTQNSGFALASLLQAGIPRVLFSYTMGMLLYRVWLKGPRLSVPPSLLLIVLGAILYLPTPHEAVVALLSTLFVFPVLIYIGACSEPAAHNRWWVTGLGVSSYAIYVIHAPILAIILHVLHPDPSRYSFLALGVTLTVVVALALLLDKFYDTPVRRWLNARRTQRVRAHV